MNDRSKFIKYAQENKLVIVPVIGKHPKSAGLIGNSKSLTPYDELIKSYPFEQKSLISGNLGLVSGFCSSIFGMDYDDLKSWKSLYDDHKDTPKTFSVKSGSGSIHEYFKYNDEMKEFTTGINVFKEQYPHIDYRNNGGFLVAPTSIYEGCGDDNGIHKCKNGCLAKSNATCIHKGKTYDVVDYKRNIEPMPVWMIDMLKTSKLNVEIKDSKGIADDDDVNIEEKNDDEDEDSKGIDDDYYDNNKEMIDELLSLVDIKHWHEYGLWRNITWACTACNVPDDVIIQYSKTSSKYNFKTMMEMIANCPNDCKLNQNYLLKCLRLSTNADTYYKFRLKHLILDNDMLSELYNTDQGMARIFLKRVGNIYKALDAENIYVYDSDSKLYVEAEKDDVESSITIIIDNIVKKEIRIVSGILKTKDDDKTILLHKFLRNRRQYVNGANGAKNVFRKLLPMIKNKHFFTYHDRDPVNIPLPNGRILNLLTLEERERTKMDFWTGELKYPYLRKKDEELTHINKFLDEIFIKNKDIIPFVKRILGYNLTTSTSAKQIYYHLGKGNNGKTVLFEMIDNVFNNCKDDSSKNFGVSNIDVRLMDAKSNNSTVGNEFVILKTCRVGVFTEPPEGMTLNVSCVKKLTGNGDKLTARKLHSNKIITYTPVLKLNCVLNELPIYNGSDIAMNNRNIIINYTNSFISTKANDVYVSDLKNNHSDELECLMINEAHEFLLHGMLETPKCVEESKNNYKKENNPIGSFVDEFCELGGDFNCPCALFLDTYNNIMKDNKTSCMLGRNMNKIDVKSAVKNIDGRSVRCYVGIRLKDNDVEHI